MNLKLNLICTLLFCFSFLKGIGQTKAETVQQSQERLNTFVTKNDPADEPYRKEMYKKYIENHHDDTSADGPQWDKLPNSSTNSVEELKEYVFASTHLYNNNNSYADSLKYRTILRLNKIKKRDSTVGLDVYIETYCMKITKITINELGQMLRDIDNTWKVQPYPEYPVDAYLESCICYPQAAKDVRVPPLFLVGEAPCSRADFLERFYKYYIVKRRDPERWLEVINQKNTNGETILDFLTTLERNGAYSTDETRACAKEIKKFVCEHGGVHAFEKGTKDDYCGGLKNK